MKEIIKNEELFDDELQQLMGDQYTDLTKEPVKPAEKSAPAEAPAEAEPTDFDLWEPINTIRNVLATAKWAVTFGGLFGLILYWQLAGLMDPAAAGPSMCVCTMLVGYGVGKNIHK